MCFRSGARTSEKHTVLLLLVLARRGVRVPDMGSARRGDGDFAYLPGSHITEANASTATSRVATWESAVGDALLLLLLNRILTRLFVRDALGRFRAHDDNMYMREATEDLATLASGQGGPSGSGLATWVWIPTAVLTRLQLHAMGLNGADGRASNHGERCLPF